MRAVVLYINEARTSQDERWEQRYPAKENVAPLRPDQYTVAFDGEAPGSGVIVVTHETMWQITQSIDVPWYEMIRGATPNRSSDLGDLIWVEELGWKRVATMGFQPISEAASFVLTELFVKGTVHT
jgi:hypothetical protein